MQSEDPGLQVGLSGSVGLIRSREWKLPDDDETPLVYPPPLVYPDGTPMMLPFEKLNHPVVSVSKPWKKNVAASIPEAQTVKSNRIPAKIAADFLMDPPLSPLWSYLR